MKRTTIKMPNHRRQTLRPTQSESVVELVNNRKASTPTNDRTSASVSPDISRILTNESNKADLSKTQVAEKPNIPKKVLKKPVSSKKEDLAVKLDLEYTRYMQSVFQNKLNGAASSDLDNNLENLQRRIEKNQDILEQTSRRLKNINFNKEIDLLHSLNKTNYGETLERLDSSNCEEYLSNLHDKLKQSSNQLKVKNIEIPEGGSAQLVQVITDTVEAFEKVKNENDVETWKTLKNTEESNTSTSLAITRCKESLPVVEELLLTYSTMKLCNKD